MHQNKLWSDNWLAPYFNLVDYIASTNNIHLLLKLTKLTNMSFFNAKRFQSYLCHVERTLLFYPIWIRNHLKIL